MCGERQNLAIQTNPRFFWRHEMSCLKYFLQVTVCSIFLIFMYVLLTQYVNQSTAPDTNCGKTLWKDASNGTQKESRQRKLILVWTGFWTHPGWLADLNDLDCPVRECDMTFNKSLLGNSSAVLLHLPNVNLNQLPDCRPGHCRPSLRWVLFHQEAPTWPPGTFDRKLKGLSGKIHWTATYKRDSDIRALYGEFLERTDLYERPAVDTNRSLACWMASHCPTPSRREDYVAALQKHMPVDTYGRCGDRPIPFIRDEKTLVDGYEWLSSRCKFYLSFENSICEDYATEKLFLPMTTSSPMVPVVLGGADYASFMPARSYVDTADFASPRELAGFLLELGNDTERYLSYLEWKRSFVVRYSVMHWWCDVCRKLHETDDDEVVAVHDDLYTPWLSRPNCSSWKPS